MVTQSYQAGTDGHVRLASKLSDAGFPSVEIWMRSDAATEYTPFPVSYSVDGLQSNSFQFQPPVDFTEWALVGRPYVSPDAQEFTFHLGDTGTTELNGPQDFLLALDQASLVDIRVNGEYVKAQPFVRTNGVWLPATPHIRQNGEWSLV